MSRKYGNLSNAVNQRSDKERFAPFPYFGGKRDIIGPVWARLGSAKHYIEPFCGSLAMLLGAPKPGILEVVGDQNLYIVNFWRALKHQPDAVCEHSDYPPSHLDLHARHAWLTEAKRIRKLAEKLSDPGWPGDAKIAGWWVWGLCCWIGRGWCDKPVDVRLDSCGQVPRVDDSGRPFVRNVVPHMSDAGQGLQSGDDRRRWLERLSQRLRNVVLIHGSWERTLNLHYGNLGRKDTGCVVFFDPPYKGFENLYGSSESIAESVAQWCRENHTRARIALCGHEGDYDLPGWDVWAWSRTRMSYGSDTTKSKECVWFSPNCKKIQDRGLFEE